MLFNSKQIIKLQNLIPKKKEGNLKLKWANQKRKIIKIPTLKKSRLNNRMSKMNKNIKANKSNIVVRKN